MRTAHSEASDQVAGRLGPWVKADAGFGASLWTFVILYIGLVLAMLAADATYTSPAAILEALRRPEIRDALQLSLLSSTITAILSVGFAIPIGYLLSRQQFRGRSLLDSLLDIPILLPPMVIGLSLLILFQTPLGRAVERVLPFTFEVPGVILAQFSVACAFAVRTMRVTFDAIDPRREAVALTLGCSRARAFWWVALPEAGPGALAAGLLAWARALGEFGPVLVFAGATRGKTEVLPSTIFLELSIGDLRAAVAVSLILVGAAVLVLVIARLLGSGGVVR
ncbi:MAG: molybdate transport system permease protein [Planctomycetota bacterium]|jgi:molybdate transport system permease protein